jgi:hypothetical protein
VGWGLGTQSEECLGGGRSRYAGRGAGVMAAGRGGVMERRGSGSLGGLSGV